MPARRVRFKRPLNIRSDPTTMNTAHATTPLIVHF
jgi:hypothetical protein